MKLLKIFVFVGFSFSVCIGLFYNPKLENKVSVKPQAVKWVTTPVVTNRNSPQPMIEQAMRLQAPLPRPEIQLVGIVIKEHARIAVVQIMDQISEFEQGDLIDNAWELVAVESNLIRLKTAKQTVNYRLQEFNGIDQSENFSEEREAIRLAALRRMESSAFREKVTAYMRVRKPAEVAYPMGVQSEGVEMLDDGHFLLDRKKILDSLNQRQLFRHIKTSFEDGALSFDDIVPGSIFDNGGLQRGDGLVTINGNSVTKPSDYFELYNILNSQDSLKLEIIRNGELMPLLYNIKN